MSDEVGDEVRLAIEGLEVLAVARDRVKWEVFPFMGMRRESRVPAVLYMIGIGVEVELTGDHVVNYDPVEDPYDRAGVARVVKALYQASEQEAAEVTAAAMKASNGHGTPGKGLILP